MRCFSVILLCFVVLGLTAQNLVPNPSFEELSRCPNSFSTDKNDFIVPGWESPTTGTPDHFHGCSWGEADVPFNWAGSANAHTGKGYTGMYVWNKRSDKSYREYIQCELAEPMVKGDKYILEFYYKLASYSVYTSNRIGLAVSTTPISYNHDQEIPIVPVISIEKDTAVTETTGGWEHAVTEYIATGDERYLVIGNFFNNENTKATRLPHRIGKNSMLTTSAYYLVDDVSVKPVDSVKVVPILPKFKQDTIELNTDYVLKNIQFEFDSYVLLRSSFVELDKVIEYLKHRPEINIRLSGHTDFIGSEEYNLTLSRSRSRSVADYFISKGINSHRIVSYGFGKARPILLEKTDEARKVNRRVEIRFVTEQVQ